MIPILLGFPILASFIVYRVQSKRVSTLILLFQSALYIAIALRLAAHPEQFTPYFKVDDVNIIFLLILGVVYFGVGLFKIGTFSHQQVTPRDHALYIISFLVFEFSMSGAILSTHAALFWVFIEATTLATTFLIAFRSSESALEAAWKYLFICSIGISVAFIGIIFLSIGLPEASSLFFDDLYAHASQISPFWLKLAFPLIVIGLGTKVGLAPVHAWLPDAHSEAPAGVSAMLSGTLLNIALLGILRFYRIAELTDNMNWARILLMTMGFLSLFVSAVYVTRIKHYKRMLAYSSVENMGIIVIGIGLGGVGLFAAFLHLIAHSLIKAAFFLTSENILRTFGTKYYEKVKAAITKDPLTGWLWMACFVGIAGIPPSPLFLSEFLIAKTLLEQGRVLLVVLFFLLLTIIMVGIGKAVMRMCFGQEQPEIQAQRSPVLAYAPQIVLLTLAALLGIIMPGFVFTLIQQAVQSF